jgi:UDP:flavonoid glycosyltransferase YjiC (YdhE family)
MYKASLKLCSENDMVISHSNIHTLYTAAEKYNCPRAAAHLFPRLIESKYIPPIGAPNLGKGMNPLLWKIGNYYTKKKLFPSANKIRAKEGFPPIKSFLREVCISKNLTLIAASPSLCISQPDWEDNIQICGFFNAPTFSEDWEMPEDLRTFIDAGDPPIYLTFGSFTAFDVEDTTRFLVETAKLSRLRAIIQSDWENVSYKPDDPDIYRIDVAPHGNIFPHCSVIVHHGGAGTTQSTLLSGCPSVIVEHAFDQNYWGQQLYRVGVAEKPLHKRTVTPRKLAAHIHKVLNSPVLKENAQKMSEKMKTEDGVKKAVELIEKHFN